MKNAYDNKGFFEEYKNLRSQEVNANNLIENPIILNMMPSVKNKKILDLGCGDGNMAKFFINQGAKSVLGIDISKNMIKEAKINNFDKNIEYQVLKMEKLDTINEKFDIVYSSLAFHYVKDFDKLLKDINFLLKKGGILIWSQENPLATSCVLDKAKMKHYVEIDNKRFYLLSDYALEGKREVFWNYIYVTKYHRTFATIINSLIKNKFEIIEVKDSFATDKAIKLSSKLVYEKDRPYFMFVKAKKS